MRDGNRLKEKIELRLDQRQATILVVVALLLAGTLFGLGVMVGMSLAALPKKGPPSPEALLDRLDAKARPDAATDGLNFQEELTRRTPTPVLSPSGAPAAIQPSSRSDPAVRAQPKVPEAGSKAAPVKVAMATPTATATTTPTASATPTATPSTAATPSTTKTAPPAPTAAPPATAAIPPLPPPPEAPAGAAASSGFTLQIKSTQSQEDADHFVRKLKGQGYHAFVVTADLPGKGRWYRVRLGKFDSKEAAEHYLQDFKRETKLNAFVTAGGEVSAMRRVEKPWGYELIWAETERYVGKVLHVNAGHRLSLQYHVKKDETIHLWSGRLQFVYDEGDGMKEREMAPGESYHIRPGTKHRMIAITDCDILEASTPELDDVVRLEDVYGRK